MKDRSVLIAVPDFISTTMFPLLAAQELGYFAREGLDIQVRLFDHPTPGEAVRDGSAAYLAGPAHAPLMTFPHWRGARLLIALAQGTPWLLVVRSGIGAQAGDLGVLRGRRIGAARGPDFVLRHMLHAAGLDEVQDRIQIGPIPGMIETGVSFGVTAGRALADGIVDGIWANALGAAVAAELGGGVVLVNARHGDGPPGAGNYSFAALATTESRTVDEPKQVAAVIRAVVRAQGDLRANPALGAEVCQRLFPPLEARLAATLVAQDAKLYEPAISMETFAALERFTQAAGLVTERVPYDAVVATQFEPFWH